MIQPFEGVWPEIDETAFVHPKATVIGKVFIGPRATIWPGAVLRGDEGKIVIGADSNIQDGAVCHSTNGLSEVEVGERVTVGHNAILHGCKVGSDTLIGMGSIVLDRAIIGDGVLLGAGSLVPMGKRIPDGQLAMGNPAKVVREMKDMDRHYLDLGVKRYVELGGLHKEALGSMDDES